MAELVVRGPSGAPVVYRLAGKAVRVGRGRECELCLADAQLSRFHAILDPAGEAWTLRDLGSRNGTLLNGRPVATTETLSDGDVVRVGRLRLTFHALASGLADGGETQSARGSPSDRDAGATAPLLVGDSEAMNAVRRAIARVAPTDATVLVTGETGTGKELAARLLHVLSSRSSGPFVVVNCPALPSTLLDSELFGIEKGVATGVEARPGRLETAAGGTVFLDEVGDLDGAAQARLLRFLQDRSIERVGARSVIHVDVRVVAATHRVLEDEVKAGRFRADLFHRLAGVRIAMPPLRDRREDIPLLVRHFLSRQVGPPVELSEEAMRLVVSSRWPGNVRSLESAMNAARVMGAGTMLEPADLPESVREDASVAVVPSLHARIVHGGESFWDVVQRPFLRRELSRDDARALVRHGWDAAGGSYKDLARLYRLDREYKKLVNFIHHHDLGVEPEPSQ